MKNEIGKESLKNIPRDLLIKQISDLNKRIQWHGEKHLVPQRRIIIDEIKRRDNHHHP